MIATKFLTDFLTGPIPLTAFVPSPRQFAIEGEPLLVNAIMRELRERVTVLVEIEYPAQRQTGWIGKRVEFVDQTKGHIK